MAFVTAMPNELRPLVSRLKLAEAGTIAGRTAYEGRSRGVEVVATRTGVGPDLATELTESLLDTHQLDRLVVCGIAGGVPPTEVGDLVIPKEVVDRRSGERFRASAPPGVALNGVIRTGDGSDYELTAQDVQELRADGITALDMETAAIAGACQRRGVPWVAFRAVSDMAGDESLGPVVMTLVNDDGTPRPWTALRFVCTHPGRIPRMVRLARDAQRAVSRAASAAAGCDWDRSEASGGAG